MPTRGVSRVAPIGKRFGRLIVQSPSRPINGSSSVDCRCECGDVRPYFIANLRVQAEPMCPACRTASHAAQGHSGKHPLFNIWKAMIQRCENPNHTWFYRYGGRGITICAEWRESFERFAADMGPRPSPHHTVDRENADGNYEPANCRWATAAEQQNNRSDTIKFEWRGRLWTIAEAVVETGMEHATLAWRYNAGWSPEELMTIPSMCDALKGRSK